jgi:beta-carotene/zeaxanthin 4-ketolase
MSQPDEVAAMGPDDALTFSPTATVKAGRLEPRRQARVGVGLAGAVIVAWLAAHVGAVFFFDVAGAYALWAVPVIALQCWLYVGLFIIAHDCMHGSLIPGAPAWNRRIGQLCLGLYAGFSFDRMTPKHHDHHRHAGLHDDPDFDDRHPHGYWRWFAKFFGEYFSWRELLAISAVTWTYLLALGAPLANVLLFWALPALLSALQLFTFGTYLPHRPSAPGFADRHNARSNDFPWLVSLLTCFHFGYHHEHHLSPGTPWWRLPRLRRGRAPPPAIQ